MDETDPESFDDETTTNRTIVKKKKLVQTIKMKCYRVPFYFEIESIVEIIFGPPGWIHPYPFKLH